MFFKAVPAASEKTSAGKRMRAGQTFWNPLRRRLPCSARILSMEVVVENTPPLRTMAEIQRFNVEAGLPTLDEARRIVIAEIKRARHAGARVLKIVHGYGSSGKGGVLCTGLRKSFRLRKKEALIRDFIPGED